jgi:hypothetical protein
MKRARQRKVSQRNFQAVAPIMKKGGPHPRLDKRAARARQKARLRREFNDGE